MLALAAGHLTFTIQQTLCLVLWQPAWQIGSVPGEVRTCIDGCWC